MTKAQKEMMSEIRDGTLTAAPTTGPRKKTWDAITGKGWAHENADNKPVLTMPGRKALARTRSIAEPPSSGGGGA